MKAGEIIRTSAGVDIASNGTDIGYGKLGDSRGLCEADSVSNSVILNGLQCTNELVVHSNEACDGSHNSQCESKVSHNSRSCKTACDRLATLNVNPQRWTLWLWETV